MRVLKAAVSFAPFFLVLALVVDARALPIVETHFDPVGDAEIYGQELPSDDIIRTTKRVRAGADGIVWLAIRVAFAGSVGGGLGGGNILLDTDREAGWDASLYFRHWDNGSDADTCYLRIPRLDVEGRVRYRNRDQTITCFFRKSVLHATHRVRWFVRSDFIGQTGERLDRAPDRGWYG